jgi:hypothetical protein
MVYCVLDQHSYLHSGVTKCIIVRQVSTNRTEGGAAATKTIAGSRLRKVKLGLKGSAILLPLLGLTWIFGLLAFNRDTIVFKYLFAICNSLQGLMIFVFHVLIKDKVKLWVVTIL